MKISAPGGVTQLFNAVYYFGHSDVGNEQYLARLSSDKIYDLGIRLGLTQLGNDIRVEQPSSQVDISNARLDCQTLKLDLPERGGSKRGDDIATAHGVLKPIELIGADDDHRILPMQCYTLRTALLSLSYDLAK